MFSPAVVFANVLPLKVTDGAVPATNPAVPAVTLEMIR